MIMQPINNGEQAKFQATATTSKTHWPLVEILARTFGILIVDEDEPIMM
jgi:hypothetical protein